MRPLRVALPVLCALAIGGVAVPSALAGGWAVTTLDPIAGELTPGKSAAIGYTVRQHGQTPVNVADTGIEIRPATGSPTFFPGRRQGTVGHYVATVTVPAAGAEWTARQGWFAPQNLGAVPNGRATQSIVVGEPPGDGMLRWILLGATILSAGGVAVQVSRMRRIAPAR